MPDPAAINQTNGTGDLTGRPGGRSSGALLRHAVILLAGSVLTVFCVSIFKLHKFENSIKSAELLLMQNQPDRALETINAFSGFAGITRRTALQSAHSRVKCLLALGDTNAASACIRETQGADFPSSDLSSPGARLLASMQALSISVYNAIRRKAEVTDIASLFPEAVSALASARDSFTETLRDIAPSPVTRAPSEPGMPGPPSTSHATPQQLNQGNGNGTVETDEAQAPSWGIIRKDRTPCYSRDGKFKGNAGLGTFVQISRQGNSSIGNVAVCTATDNPMIPVPILVRIGDLLVFPGSMSDLTPAEKKLHIRRVSILEEIEKIARQPNPANPHAKEYGRARDEMAEFARKARALQDKRDKASGEAFMEIADELRKMKNDEFEIKRKYDDAKVKYDQWNASHRDIENPVISNLRSELASIESQLPGLQGAR